jgi:primosomal protein N' (replication factor Y)
MPAVRLVDLAREYRGPGRWSRIVTRSLEEALSLRLERGEQSILFLNRRGFSPALTCRSCGEAVECPNCSVAMTYHRRDARLRCHYCGLTRPPVETCPACGETGFTHQGLGTQRVEAVLEETFPAARILRMDSDTTRLRGSHAELYRAFSQGEGDILLGTQMVARGFHFPGVTLVGVISADAELHFPDFRSNERTYQLLVQVAGRAGRGEEPGEVIIQTFSADNPGVSHAVAGDYAGFMNAELEHRQALGYPPLGRMVRVLVKGRDEAAALRAGRDTGERLRAAAGKGVVVLGPAPAPLYRLNRWYRVHLFLRGAGTAALHRCVEMAALETSRGGIVTAVDVDPVDVL